MITVWQNGDAVLLHQLSDDLEDGSPEQQVAHLATLDIFAGYTCVEMNFGGSAPNDVDPSLWRWDDLTKSITHSTPLLPVPETITRRQCAIQLMKLGMITGPEAVAMTRDGTPPAVVSSYFGALTEEQRILAEIDFAAGQYERSNLLIGALMAATGKSEADADEFFRAAAVL